MIQMFSIPFWCFLFSLVLWTDLSCANTCQPPNLQVCNFISVTSSVTVDTNGRFTKFCYTFNLLSTSASISRFDVFGGSYDYNSVFVNASKFGAFDAIPGRIRSLEPINRQLTSSTIDKCFELPGSVTAIDGDIYVFTNDTYCITRVSVPASNSINTPVNCVLDEIQRNWQAGTCDAVCQGAPVAKGKIKYTKPIIKPAINGGLCESQVYLDCTINCDVDCVKTLEPIKPCPADCKTPSVTVTRFYQVVTPAAGNGRKCDPQLSFVTNVCVATCPVDCTLESTVSTNCATCDAKCPGNKATVPGTMYCPLPTKVAPINGGKQCTPSTLTSSCIKKCPIDCVMSFPTWNPAVNKCPANCKTPTQTIDIYATVAVSPLNGGRPCIADMKSAVTCSIGAAEISTRCKQGCIVDGIPDNVCSKACATRTKGVFVTSATYPITLSSGEFDSCPESTTTCKCPQCVLAPTPTSVSPCDAICVARDGKYAMGKKTVRYSVVQSSLSAFCESTSVLRCSKLCNCQWTSSDVGDCAYSKTVSSISPVIAYGQAYVTQYGVNAACSTRFYKQCSSTVSISSCKSSASCNRDAICTSTAGGNYLLSYKPECTTSIRVNDDLMIVDDPSCSTQDFTRFTTEKTCPGCLYSSPLVCGCSITSSKTNAQSTEVYGFQTCEALEIIRQSQVSGVSSSPLCTRKTAVDFNVKCSKTLGPNDCFYGILGCGVCSYNSKQTAAGSVFGVGTKTCTLTDQRTGKIPSNCGPKPTIAECTQRIMPTEGITRTFCNPCGPKCDATDSGIKTEAVQCSTKVLKRGSVNSFIDRNSPPDSSVCSTTCYPAATIAPKNPLDSIPNLSLFVINNAWLEQAEISKKAVICGNATLFGVNIGQDLSEYINSNCDAQSAVLFVQKDLLMFGKTWGGQVTVGGRCSNQSISLECGSAQCNALDTSCLTTETKMFGDMCSLMSAAISQFMDEKAAQVPTAYVEAVSGTNRITWSDQSTWDEILEIPDTGKAILPFNWYSRDLSKNINVYIIVRGKNIVLKSFSLEYFNDLKSIFWLFPEAEVIELSEIKLYGTVMAPKAILKGNGKIKGQVAVKSMNSSISVSF